MEWHELQHRVSLAIVACGFKVPADVFPKFCEQLASQLKLTMVYQRPTAESTGHSAEWNQGYNAAWDEVARRLEMEKE